MTFPHILQVVAHSFDRVCMDSFDRSLDFWREISVQILQPTKWLANNPSLCVFKLYIVNWQLAILDVTPGGDIK